MQITFIPLWSSNNHDQEHNLADYMAATDKKVREDWQVADLSQFVRNGRGRTETVDKHLQTLTTNCGRFYGKAMGYKKEFQTVSEVDRIFSNKFVPLPKKTNRL